MQHRSYCLCYTGSNWKEGNRIVSNRHCQTTCDLLILWYDNYLHVYISCWLHVSIIVYACVRTIQICNLEMKCMPLNKRSSLWFLWGSFGFWSGTNLHRTIICVCKNWNNKPTVKLAHCLQRRRRSHKNSELHYNQHALKHLFPFLLKN